jgi:hypothetical protein
MQTGSELSARKVFHLKTRNFLKSLPAPSPPCCMLPTLPLGSHWMFDVGCWMLDVPLRPKTLAHASALGPPASDLSPLPSAFQPIPSCSTGVRLWTAPHRNSRKINRSRAESCPVVDGRSARPNLRRSVFGVGCSMFPTFWTGSRYNPWSPLSNPPETRIGIPCRCVYHGALSLSEKTFSRNNLTGLGIVWIIS